MRVLLVDAYPAGHTSGAIVSQVIATLEALGNDVDVLPVAGDNFAGFMTTDERHAYESDAPLVSADTQAAAAAVQAAEALVFCYPTTLFGVPPELKAWLERVMVLGVAFVFDDKKRIRPGMKNIRRLAVVTTSGHTRAATWRARDQGHRTVMRTLRLNCHPRCRRTFVRLASDAPAGRVADQLLRSFRGFARSSSANQR